MKTLQKTLTNDFLNTTNTHREVIETVISSLAENESAMVTLEVSIWKCRSICPAYWEDRWWFTNYSLDTTESVEKVKRGMELVNRYSITIQF